MFSSILKTRPSCSSIAAACWFWTRSLCGVLAKLKHPRICFVKHLILCNCKMSLDFLRKISACGALYTMFKQNVKTFCRFFFLFSTAWINPSLLNCTYRMYNVWKRTLCNHGLITALNIPVNYCSSGSPLCPLQKGFYFRGNIWQHCAPLCPQRTFFIE